MKKFTDRLKDLTSNPNIQDGLNTIKKTMDDGMQTVQSQWGNLGEGAKEKYTTIINQAFSVIPLLDEIGYNTTDFLVHIGMPTAVEVRIDTYHAMEKEDFEVFKKHYEGNKFFLKVLEALFMATELQRNFKTGELEPSGLELMVGMTPRVSLVYRKSADVVE